MDTNEEIKFFKELLKANQEALVNMPDYVQIEDENYVNLILANHYMEEQIKALELGDNVTAVELFKKSRMYARRAMRSANDPFE